MWLLALAIPTQGFAASTMFFCGPGHHGSTASLAVTAHVHASEVHTGVPSRSASGSDHHRYSPKAETPPTARPTAVGGKLTGSKPRGKVGGKCSACAACCTSVAIGATALLVEVVPLVRDYAASPAEPPARLSTGGLERPPKHLLA